MTKLIKKLLRVKPLLFIGLLYTSFLTIVFLLPISELPKVEFLNDKLIHTVLYIVLSFVWLLFLFIYNNWNIVFKNVLFILLLCLIYGIIIELLQQLLITSRQADIYDVISNLLGSIIGITVFWNVKNRIKT